MSFSHYLSAAEAQEIVDAAVDSGVMLASRRLLLKGIRPKFAMYLPLDDSPLDQFRGDLAAMNTVERLLDNSVPLEIFLANAAEQAGELPQSKVFRKYENQVHNAATGIAALAPMAEMPAEVMANEAIIHQDDTVDLDFFTGCVRSARSVVKLVVPRFDVGVQRLENNRPWLFNGTGWLIADDLVITNHHVVNSRGSEGGMASAADFERQALASDVLFDYDSEGGTPLRVGVKALEAHDAQRDYCVLRLAASSGRQPLPVARLRTEITATTYLPVNVIQHPGGKAKRVAVRNNLAVHADSTLLRYYTDTDYGSSGSPVMDDRWQVLALHRGAVLSRARFQGQDTAFVNVGSHMAWVLEDLKDRYPTLHDTLLPAI